MNVVLSVVFIILGVLFILLGLAGAVLELWKKYFTKQNSALGFNLPDINKLMDAFTALLKELAAAPIWLALFVVGLALVFVGAFVPFPK
jgi:uncharacterized membrane protein